MPATVTLTTDFGLRDGYVAAMKGAMLSVDPALPMVDVSHQIAPQDVMEAAYVLKDAAPYFPAGTVHLAVVDPGVGTERRAVAVRAGGQLYVAPDNGLIPLVLNGTEPEEIVELDRPAFWRTGSPVTTFHGRDLFGPAAAHLASGRSLSEVGTPAGALLPLYWALPLADDQGVQGFVVHVDHYGNCVTNIEQELLEARRCGRSVKCYVGTTILNRIHGTYASVSPGEPVVLYGSSGKLEISVNGGDASELLTIQRGNPVNIVFAEGR